MKLPDEFYAQDVLAAAPALLGKLLCRRLPNGETLRLRIAETEAYRGADDTACHAHKGKTKRTAVMFEAGGAAYIYLCYGMHNLLNIVTGSVGEPQAALIRGVEGYPGPARLTRAMQIDRSLNGIDLRTSGALWLEDDGFQVREIATAPRVGIGYASAEDQARLWRFMAG